jgi:hypothetical protein
MASKQADWGIRVTSERRTDRQVIEIISAIMITLAAPALLAGCGGSTKVAKTPGAGPGSATGLTSLPTERLTPTAAPVGRIGSALAVSTDDEQLKVQLVQIIDPGTATPRLALAAGTRVVALKLVIADAGTLAVTDDADADTLVKGSNHQSYSALEFADAVGCTNFDAGSFTLVPGSNTTGCVLFEIPTGVRVSQVQFTAFGHKATKAYWLVP